MFKPLDKLLDRVTMYRLLLYYLIALVLIAMGLSAAGVLNFSVGALAASTIILLLACYIINRVFAAIFQAPTNVESVYITALILALIISPIVSHQILNITFLLAVSGLAMASKYLLTINKKHIFNPAAIAVALTAIGPRQSASWWIGTKAMLPFVLIGGILLVRKMRCGRMVTAFFISTLLATALYNFLAHNSVFSALDRTLLTSAMFFLGFVMLTEPQTMPPTAAKQTWYAVLAGVLFPPQFHILSLYSTPELALVASNIFSYIISPKTKLLPTLKRKIRLTPDAVEFIFSPDQKFSYVPGQYMEWTLQHPKTDSRGNRRYFTLASSPTEPDIRLSVKFYRPSSSYKKALLELPTGTTLVAGQISGDFVLPKDRAQKIVFIAGGIGITPYRSMVKYLLDNHQAWDITLLYSANRPEDFAYYELFEQARKEIGLKTAYAVTSRDSDLMGEHSRRGFINAGMIRAEVPDYKQRLFYISGTQGMVTSMREILIGLDVPQHHIKVDFFSGYS